MQFAFNKRVCTDVMTLKMGAFYVLGVCDQATQEIALPVMTGMESKDCIFAFEDRWSSTRGNPTSIVSDKGKSFVASLFENYM